ncbi:6-phosphogluconolactonase [Rhizobium puerariae]|uniref:6-phosphogluconolactonase n=1 Tax=Rhizobium puerariae TaxID=1585791 RepID=A0ABV6AKH3_9HYPH
MQTRKYDQLEVRIFEKDEEIGVDAAAELAKTIKAELARKDEITIIMALGAAQPFFFPAIIARDDIEWSRINVLHVDTYMGVAEDWIESGASRMRRHLLDHVKPKAFYPMLGDTVPVEAELERYTKIYNELQPCLTVVGIGESAHLAFNDPPADFTTTEVIKAVMLDEKTRGQIKRRGFFENPDDIPYYALSLTMHALLKTGRVLALAHEPQKAQAVKDLLEGPLSIMCPASILQKTANATLFLGPESSALLEAK